MFTIMLSIDNEDIDAELIKVIINERLKPKTILEVFCKDITADNYSSFNGESIALNVEDFIFPTNKAHNFKFSGVVFSSWKEFHKRGTFFKLLLFDGNPVDCFESLLGEGNSKLEYTKDDKETLCDILTKEKNEIFNAVEYESKDEKFEYETIIDKFLRILNYGERQDGP